MSMSMFHQYGTPGDKFDPNVHDALFEYEDPGKEPGCVGQVGGWVSG